MFDAAGDDFKKFFGYLMLLGFLILFFNGIKSDVEKRYPIKSSGTARANYNNQNVRQKLYPAGYQNNIQNSATVYYIR